MPTVKIATNVEDYEAMIERYKVQNPVKYLRKKKELAAKLDKLKHPVKEEEDETLEVVVPPKEVVKKEVEAPKVVHNKVLDTKGRMR